MGTIKEAYVSFEIASLLNEKGFDGDCRARYDNNGSFHYEKYPIEASGAEMHNSILCPTHQMVMTWLREVHDVYIDISIYVITVDILKYSIGIYYKKHKNDSMYLGIHLTKECSKYEEAAEVAIKYCLEKKLI